MASTEPTSDDTPARDGPGILRGWLVPFLMLVGLTGPLLLVTLYAFGLQRDALESTFESELDATVQMLANGMREPVWNLIAVSGQPLLEAVAEDPRVVSVKVSSVAQETFLGLERLPPDGAVLRSASRPIERNGEVIGEVTLVMDRSRIEAEIQDQWRNVLVATAIQATISLVIVLLAARLYGVHQRAAGLRRMNAALNREIEERREAEREMRKAKEEAQFANRTKTEFIANVSHEFRTPLNAILGFSDLMNREILGPMPNERYRSYVRDILEAGQHLHGLIEDVLDISRIEVNATVLRERPCDLASLFGSCMSIVSLRAEKEGIDLVTDLPPGMPALLADPRAMKQILINLLGNAVKFTRSGGKVTLSAERTADGGIAISVRDNGIGMAPEDVPRALEPFTQLSRNSTQSAEGSGLGLALVAALVRTHGAAIDIDSAPGRGTTVRIAFPAARSLEPGDGAPSADG